MEEQGEGLEVDVAGLFLGVKREGEGEFFFFERSRFFGREERETRGGLLPAAVGSLCVAGIEAAKSAPSGPQPRLPNSVVWKADVRRYARGLASASKERRRERGATGKNGCSATGGFGIDGRERIGPTTSVDVPSLKTLSLDYYFFLRFNALAFILT